MPTAQQREQAAILIQSKTRGYLTRKKTKHPQLAKLENYETLITGNDGVITFTPAELRHDGKFIFVGCSGMNSLALLCNLIAFRSYTPSKDGCDNIPKLFVIDNSMQVKIFWKNLKHIFTKSKNQVDFNFNALATNDKFSSCCRNLLPNFCACDECSNFAALQIIAKLRDITKDNDIAFQFVRNVVEKMTFLAHDWAAREPFDFIKRHAGKLPIYVYPSNIVEFLTVCPLPDVSHAMHQVVTNICSLQPIVTLHTRTSLSYRTSVGICPENVVKVRSTNPRDHFSTLQAPAFGTLEPKRSLFNNYVSGAVGAEPPPGSYMDPTTMTTRVPKLK